MANVTGGTASKPSYTQLISSGLVSAYAIPVEITNLGRIYSNGTGPLQVDLLHAKQYSLVASTPQTLDLTTILDPGGGVAAFARIRELVVQNLSAYPVTIGGAAATAWTGMLGTSTSTIVVPGGGSLVISDPASVGSSVGAVVTSVLKSLKLDPGANAVTLNLILVGCSATS